MATLTIELSSITDDQPITALNFKVGTTSGGSEILSSIAWGGGTGHTWDEAGAKATLVIDTALVAVGDNVYVTVTDSDSTPLSTTAYQAATSVSVPAILTTKTNAEYFESTVKYSWTTGYSVKFKCDWVYDYNLYLFGNDLGSGSNGAVTVASDLTTDKFKVRVRDSTGLIEFPDLTLSYGDEIEIKMTGADEFELWINGVLNNTITTTGFIGGINQEFIFGALNNVPEYNHTAKFWDIVINGETFPMTEGTGNTTVGSSGTVLTLHSTADVNNMWTTAS